MTQLKIQNQLNSNHDQIRFKSVIFQNRSFFMQKVEIFIQKQSVMRHHLSQYIVDEKYVKNTHKKLFDSKLRFIYDVSKIDNIYVFTRHLTMTYEKQIDQWKKKRILTRLWVKKFRAFAKISKMIRAREVIMNDIKIKMTIIFKSIIVQHDISFFKHIDNMSFQQLWKLCDLENYEVIFEIMREYLKSRKNEFMIKKLFSIEFFHTYKRFVIQSLNYFDRFMKQKQTILNVKFSTSSFSSFFSFSSHFTFSSLSSLFRFFSLSSLSSLFSSFISKTQTKSNEFINMKNLLTNMLKSSDKRRRKRHIEKKLKTKRKRIEKRIEKHWYWEIFARWKSLFFRVLKFLCLSAFFVDIFTQLKKLVSRFHKLFIDFMLLLSY